MKRSAQLLFATSSIALGTGAQAAETTTYTYDATGRLVATSSSGTVNNGVSASISYDAAGNRSSYTVTGATGGGGGGMAANTPRSTGRAIVPSGKTSTPANGKPSELAANATTPPAALGRT